MTTKFVKKCIKVNNNNKIVDVIMNKVKEGYYRFVVLSYHGPAFGQTIIYHFEHYTWSHQFILLYALYWFDISIFILDWYFTKVLEPQLKSNFWFESAGFLIELLSLIIVFYTMRFSLSNKWFRSRKCLKGIFSK